MATENIRREPLPVRMPGQAAEAEPASGAAPVTRLRCPSFSAEMTSVGEHALVSDRGDGPVRWTSEAEVMTATLRRLRESLASVSPPGGVEVTEALPTSSEQPHLRLVPPVDEAGAEAPPTEVAEPATGPEDVAEQESPATDAAPGGGVEEETPATDAPPEGGVEESTPSTDVAPADEVAAPAPEGRASASRRRRQGFFARVLTVRTFRGERDQARAAREHDVTVGSLLEAAADGGVLSLHHRRLPGRRGEVAHLAVCPAGIVVVHSRHLEDPAAVGTVRAQVAAVRAELAAVSLDDVRVDGVVCLGGNATSATEGEPGRHDVRVVRPSDLTMLLTVPGPLSEEHRQTLHEFLAAQLPATR